MKKFTLLLALFSVLLFEVKAQRYLTEVFSDVTVTNEVTYGVNATVLLVSVLGEAVPQELQCDIYEPAGDTETNRPLIVLMHTGNFLPPDFNGGCTGTTKDADIVDLATRLAKMGYVVAAADYRLGWNPVDPDQTVRVFTLINAAYRGVQDSRTCIRFFRRTVEENGNPYGIDPNKIILWGVGTGGYIAYASATLDTITDTWIPKFITPFGPMVVQEINGDIDATTVGIVPPGYPGFPEGDTLCYPNHVGYSSEFSLMVNSGGALGDTSWIDADDPPMISFHVPTDPFAPCEIGQVIVPPPLNLDVVEVMGSCTVQPMANELGINDPFWSIDYAAYGDIFQDITDHARSINGNLEGFYPFFSSDPTEAGPWGYSTSLEPYGVPGSNCDTNSVEASAYLDTIVWYFAPRAAGILDLVSSIEEIIPAEDVQLKVSPNPASDHVLFETAAEFPIEDLFLYNLDGKYVGGKFGIHNNQFRLERKNLPPGLYIAKLRFKDGLVTQKVLFR